MNSPGISSGNIFSNGLGLKFLQRRNTQKQEEIRHRSITSVLNDTRNGDDNYYIAAREEALRKLENRASTWQHSRSTTNTSETLGNGLYFDEQDRQWYKTTTDDLSIQPLSVKELDNETYEEKLSKWRQYFDDGPLMRCLDTPEEREAFNDLLFESLLRDVKEPSPLKPNPQSAGYRGVVGIRAFWDDIRRDLNVVPELEDEVVWPAGYPDYESGRPRSNTPDALDDYLRNRWTMFLGNHSNNNNVVLRGEDIEVQKRSSRSLTSSSKSRSGSSMADQR